MEDTTKHTDAAGSYVMASDPSWIEGIKPLGSPNETVVGAPESHLL